MVDAIRDLSKIRAKISNYLGFCELKMNKEEEAENSPERATTAATRVITGEKCSSAIVAGESTETPATVIAKREIERDRVRRERERGK